MAAAVCVTLAIPFDPEFAMHKHVIALGAAAMALAVAAGAFGAHGLRGRLSPDMFAVYQTAVQYHVYHALGLILIGLAGAWLPASAWLRAAAWCMGAGLILFSGSLYALSLTGYRMLGVVTPFGGLAFIAAWVAFAAAAWRQ